MKIKFTKYQGTGNDFILIDDRNKVLKSVNAAQIKGLCDRRFGIGADGLILLQDHDQGDFYMKYFNSDGMESSMCGNGGRCISQFAFDLGLENDLITFFAIDGKHQSKFLKDENGLKIISLQMIPVNRVETKNKDSFVIDTGSPHYVHFMADPIEGIDLNKEARNIRYSNEYKDNGINVNFVNVLSLKEIKIRTYERGVEDETLSCGTGATASALSTAIFNNFPDGVHQVGVHVNGGNLKVKFNYHKNLIQFSDIWLEGPVHKVFDGNIEIG